MNNSIMKPYMDLGRQILESGDVCDDRTGAGTLSLFGHMLKFDTRLGAPFLTERRLPMRAIAGELAWFLEGSVDVKVLREDYKCSFWNEWESPVTGTIGPMYGEQWRGGNGVDQLASVLHEAAIYPDSRRLIVNTWRPELIPDNITAPMDNPESGIMSLAPCHFAYQLRLYNDENSDIKWVDIMVHLRSSDYILGLPVNIASYHMLQVYIAAHLTQVTGRDHKARHLNVTLGDVHVYRNHIEACHELMSQSSSPIIPRYELDTIINYHMHERHANLTAADRTVILNNLLGGVIDYTPTTIIKAPRNV